MAVVTRLWTSESGVWIPAEVRDFAVHTHPDWFWGPNSFLYKLPGGKAAMVWSDHSPQSSAEVKNKWHSNSSPLICITSMNKDNFTCTFYNTLGCIIDMCELLNLLNISYPACAFWDYNKHTECTTQCAAIYRTHSVELLLVYLKYML